jgi:hypothetical protein
MFLKYYFFSLRILTAFALFSVHVFIVSLTISDVIKFHSSIFLANAYQASYNIQSASSHSNQFDETHQFLISEFQVHNIHHNFKVFKSYQALYALNQTSILLTSQTL